MTENDYSSKNITTKVGDKVTQTGKVTIGNGNTQTIAFTNTRNVGTAKITKTVSSISSVDTGRAYHFKAILMDGETKLWEDEFDLKTGGTKEYKGIPTGAVLTVTENDYSSNNITTKVGNTTKRTGTVTIGNGDAQTIAFTNTRNIVDKTKVTKTVISNSPADVNTVFTFTAKLYDGDDGKTPINFPSDTAITDIPADSVTAAPANSNSATFTLKHGQTATFTNLP